MKKYNLGYLSAYRTELMGIAMIWIVGLHGTELYPGVDIPQVTALFSRGNIGVDIFLFLSGVGMYFSLSKGSNQKDFLLKRLKRVLIPYLVLSLPYWIYKDIFCLSEPMHFIEDYLLISFWTRGVKTTWYIALIIPLYLIYPLIYSIQERVDRSNKTKYFFLAINGILCVVVTNIIINKYFPSFYADTEIALTRIPVFIFGSFVAPFIKEKKKLSFGYIAIIILSIFGMYFWLNYKSEYPDLAVMIYRYSSFGIGLLVMLISVLLIDLAQRWNIYQDLLTWLGGRTLEMYLIHIFVRRLFIDFGVGVTVSDLEQTLLYISLIAISFYLVKISHSMLDKCF